MKKIKKLFFFVLCFILLFGCTKNKEYKYDGSVYDDSYGYKDKYCYKYFESKNDKQAKLYSDIYLTSVDFNHKNPNISYGKSLYTFFTASCKGYSLTLNETRQVFDVFAYENPEFYYLNEICYDNKKEFVSFEISKKYYKRKERNRLNKKIEKEMKKLDEEMISINDEFDKVKYIYDYITTNMSFSADKSGNPSKEYYAHNIIGFFDKKEGVCETYSKTFALFLNKYGIDNIPTFSSEHIWNLVKVCNNWFMFDLTYDIFGLCEEEFIIESDVKHEYDELMIEMPKMATSSLSLSYMVLYEDGVEIYRSHSIDDIYSKFNGGNYKIILDAINAKNINERKFPINYINTNYNSLTIASNYPMKDYIEDLYYTFMILTGDLVIEKDVTIEKISIADRNINYGRTGALRNPFEVYISEDATLYINLTNIKGERVVIIDE